MLRKIKPIDRKAKRFRASKGRTNVLTQDLFYQFKEAYPNTKIKDFKEFKSIIKTFNEALVDLVITDRDGFQLPFNLGAIFLGAYKPIKQPIDRKKSEEVGYEVKHKNYETDGLACKIFYSSYISKYKLAHRQLWMFTPHRQFKVKASKSFKKLYKLFKIIERGENPWRKIKE